MTDWRDIEYDTTQDRLAAAFAESNGMPVVCQKCGNQIKPQRGLEGMIIVSKIDGPFHFECSPEYGHALAQSMAGGDEIECPPSCPIGGASS